MQFLVFVIVGYSLTAQPILASDDDRALVPEGNPLYMHMVLTINIVMDLFANIFTVDCLAHSSDDKCPITFSLVGCIKDGSVMLVRISCCSSVQGCRSFTRFRVVFSFNCPVVLCGSVILFFVPED